MGTLIGRTHAAYRYLYTIFLLNIIDKTSFSPIFTLVHTCIQCACVCAYINNGLTFYTIYSMKKYIHYFHGHPRINKQLKKKTNRKRKNSAAQVIQMKI